MSSPEFLDRVYELVARLFSTKLYFVGAGVSLLLGLGWAFSFLRRVLRQKPAAVGRVEKAEPISISAERISPGVLLPDIAKRLTSARDLKEIRELIISQVRLLFPFASEVGLFQADGDAKGIRTLRLRTSFGLDSAAGKNMVIPWGQGVIGLAAAQVMILWRSEVENRFGRQVARQDEELNLYAPDVAVPLVVREHLLGCLTLRGVDASETLPSEKQALGFVADLAAISLSHAQQIVRLDEVNRELQKQSRELAGFNENLQGLVSQQVAQLRQTEHQLLQIEHLAVFGEFVAALAHDIKTPLAFISGEAQWANELLREEKTDPEGLQKSLEIIQKNTERLRMDLQTLLQKFRMPELQLEQVDLGVVLREVFEMARAMAQQKGVQLALDIPKALAPLPGYGGLLRHAFTNLLSNALDAAPDGGTIRASVQDRGDALEVEIRDTGRGIAKEDLPHIFELFFSKRDGGHGLGLSSTKRIVEKQHAGRISVQSEVGKGTCFIVVLPKTHASEVA